MKIDGANLVLMLVTALQYRLPRDEYDMPTGALTFPHSHLDAATPSISLPIPSSRLCDR
jgi:hypothetical protein